MNTALLWVLGIIAIGLLGFFVLGLWGLFNHPDRPSLTAYHERLNALPCERAVTHSIIRALHSIPAGINQAPHVDEPDETFLCHYDFEGATIRIRTQEMCAEGLSPEFTIETPSSVYEDFEEGPFDSAESELDHYLNGAKAIAEALVDEGLERITSVTIDDKNYSL